MHTIQDKPLSDGFATRAVRDSSCRASDDGMTDPFEQPAMEDGLGAQVSIADIVSLTSVATGVDRSLKARSSKSFS